LAVPIENLSQEDKDKLRAVEERVLQMLKDEPGEMTAERQARIDKVEEAIEQLRGNQ
jgi:hypothetical protein